jgi:hypothetical protein
VTNPKHKMKQSILCLFLLIFNLGKAHAQELSLESNKWRFFDFQTGYIQLKENNLHSRVFNGFQYVFSYTVILEKENQQKFQVSLGNSNLKAGPEVGLNSLSALLQINYNYFFNIQSNNRWDYYAGIGSKLNYNISFFENWDESHLYWANFLDLNFSQQLSLKTINGNSFTGTLTLPVFHFLSRPKVNREYKMDDFSLGGILKSFHNQPQFQFFSKSFYLEGAVEYKYNKKAGFYPYLSYNFGFYALETNYSNSKQSIHHRIGLKWEL